MILTCPDCATSYFVDDAKIPAALNARLDQVDGDPTAVRKLAVETITDVTAAEEAAAAATHYAEDVEAVTAEVTTATAAVQEKATALAEAQRALGASLPATAQGIVDQNGLARQSFRDAVTASAAAVAR